MLFVFVFIFVFIFVVVAFVDKVVVGWDECGGIERERERNQMRKLSPCARG
jgi:regulatory protein YycI of two-component signal transduction system YycFG